MRLYSYWRSSASWRVRIALAWKELHHELVPVHLVAGGGEQKREAYRAVNPMAQVPTLEWTEGGETRRLTQSVAICEFLETRAPRSPLLPADPWHRALVRERVEVVNSGIQPLHNLGVTDALREAAPGADPGAWNAQWIRRGLAALEALSVQSARAHFVGDAVTLADVFLVPQLYAARRFGVDLAPYPRLVSLEAAVAALPAFVGAHPDRQPDAPPPEKRTP